MGNPQQTHRGPARAFLGVYVILCQINGKEHEFSLGGVPNVVTVGRSPTTLRSIHIENMCFAKGVCIEYLYDRRKFRSLTSDNIDNSSRAVQSER